MPNVFYGFFNVETDTTAPVVSNRFPANAATNIIRATNISFHVTESGDSAGFVSTDIDVEINGTPAIVAGVFQAGFVGTINPIANGFSVFINPNTDFTLGQVVTVQVTAQDLAVPPNIIVDSWTFYIVTDVSPPVVTNNLPTGTGVPFATHVTFDITDPGVDGVRLSSVVVNIEGTIAYTSSAQANGFTVIVTPIAGGYHFDIDPPADWTVGQNVSVSIAAEDLHVPPNVMTTFMWNFEAIFDVSPPVVVNRSPVAAAVNVAVTSNIYFEVVDVGISGVALASIDAGLNGAPMIVNGVLQAGFTGTLTPITGGYAVDINPAANLLLFETYAVTVYAEDNLGNFVNSSWTFDTEEGALETPRLYAVGGLDSILPLHWTANQGMRVTLFELRRSVSGFPSSPVDGELVYQGLAMAFNDLNIVNGTAYFYTVFVVRKFVSLVPIYVDYELPASDDASPAAARTRDVREPEYIPVPGDFGVRIANPLPHARLISIWGQNGSRSDLLACAAGREVLSPVRGRVVELVVSGSGTSVAIATDSGMSLRLYPVSVIDRLIVNQVIEPGQLIGRTLGFDVSFSVTKLPSPGFGRRTVRPSYFYLTVERRT